MSEYWRNISRTQCSCVVICHVLDRKVEGSNLAAAKNLCQFKSTKISSQKSEQKKYIGKDQRKVERERALALAMAVATAIAGVHDMFYTPAPSTSWTLAAEGCRKR